MSWRCCCHLLVCLTLIATAFATQPAYASGRPLVVGGTLVVNDYTDADARDNFLSLREAMSVVAGALPGPFTLPERVQMPGCTFNASGMIIGGCGAGGDTIHFAPALTEIVLTSNLPPIVKEGLTINGAVSAGKIVINANAVVTYGFRVNADQVTLTNLTIVNTSGNGNAIRLENTLRMGLQIYNNYLGVRPGSTSCSAAAGITSRPYIGILLLGGSGMADYGYGTAYIDNNVIGCAQNDGIVVQDAPYVYIGQNLSGGSAGNWIGVSRTGADIGNDGRGIFVCCSNFATANQILGNHIAFNALDGIHLNQAGGATVNYNDIIGNSGPGIHVLDSASVTIANNTAHGNSGPGIWLDQTNPSPLLTRDNHIIGGAYYQNGAAGISESPFAAANTWSQISTYANFGLGVDKQDNGLPDTPAVTLDSLTPVAQGVRVDGTLTTPVLIGNTYHIELYRIDPDPTGYGEGRHFIGSTDVTWNLAGNNHWSIANPSGLGCYTAILTDTDLVGGTSSEFSTNLGTRCILAYLPTLVR